MANSNKIMPLVMKSIDSATFTGAYQVIDAAGLPHSCVILRIINDSDRDITISWNGSADNDYLRAGETLQLPFQSNAIPSSFVAQIPTRTPIYVKGAAGTGLVYLTGYFVV